MTAPLEKWSSPVAQAKRSDGGVLKVEQPGGPLAMEEFDRIKRIEKHKFLQRRCRWRNLCQFSMIIIVYYQYFVTLQESSLRATALRSAMLNQVNLLIIAIT